MSVQVSTLPDTASRTTMVLDRMEYEADPDAFQIKVMPEQQALMKKLMDARGRLRSVRLNPALQLLISDVCSR